MILFGIPYQYTKSNVLRARLDYMREKYLIRDNDFLTFDALRQAAQCVGRVIRSKRDYGAVILADSRYSKKDKRDKFPLWITQFLGEGALNLSVDVSVAMIKTFLKDMGQKVINLLPPPPPTCVNLIVIVMGSMIYLPVTYSFSDIHSGIISL